MNYIITGVDYFTGRRNIYVGLNFQNTINGFSQDFDIAFNKFSKNHIIFKNIILPAKTRFCHFDVGNSV